MSDWATYNDRWWRVPPTAANVTITTAKNATFNDAFQFDAPVPGTAAPTWQLFPNFRMDIKAYLEQPAFLLSFTSAAGQIVVDDPVQRVLHFNVPESVIAPVLCPGEYLYDLVMFDNSAPAIRVSLMYGKFIVSDGVTGG